MYTRAALISTLLAVAEARFGQEQEPVAAVQALSDFGEPGQAATLAGAIPNVLLGGTDPCEKLSLGDQIVSELGNDPQVISAAAAVVAAEKNFNPFTADIPDVCGDATLPATAELRGIVPLVDPAVGGSDTENANSATSLDAPFNADGMSVADVMAAQGFSNFTVDGQAAGDAGDAAADDQNADAGDDGDGADDAVPIAPINANATAQASGGAGAVDDPVTGTFPGFQASSLGLDFGTCTPTLKFEESLNGRKPGESTFQAQDPVVNQGQQEALNPKIIMNRICDQLVNVCDAADDAHQACLDAMDKLADGPKDATTADAWNTQLGFEGADTNPDNAPKDGLVGHT